MTKSPNKHNRLYCTAEPLDEELTNEIDAGKVGPKDDPKLRTKHLVETYDWERSHT